MPLLSYSKHHIYLFEGILNNNFTSDLCAHRGKYEKQNVEFVILDNLSAVRKDCLFFLSNYWGNFNQCNKVVVHGQSIQLFANRKGWLIKSTADQTVNTANMCR